MSGMKSLAKDTAIYGLSSILGRFLNWCFVFLYINALKTTAEYGIVTNLYAYMALLLIILTYGLETGFFRFANDKEYKDPLKVYTTGHNKKKNRFNAIFKNIEKSLSAAKRIGRF